MLRKAFVVFCAFVVLLGVTAGSAAAYAPSPGGMFNNPRGASAAKYRILSNIIRSVNNTPRHATIRIAAYSFDRKDVADALLKACNRHVAVQMVLNDNWTSRQTLRLQRRMGTNVDRHLNDGCNRVVQITKPNSTCRTTVSAADPGATSGSTTKRVTDLRTGILTTTFTTTNITDKTAGPHGTVTTSVCVQRPYPVPSFVKICTSSCRGGAGNQHMKFYMFSRTGNVSNVTMIGSANLTRFGAVMQWNDMFTTVNNRGMWSVYSAIFAELARDKRVSNPYRVRTVGDLENRFSPHPDTTISNDPMMRRLNKVRCRAAGGTGINGHTAIRILMYGWQGQRGLYLANKVANLDRHGCDVRVILSSPGHQVIGALKRGGVLVKSADLDLNGNPDDGFEQTGYELFTHEKWMALSGGYGSTSSRNVWTGSENWSNLALMNDEVNIAIPRRSAYLAYAANFDYIWAHWSRWL